MFWSMLTKFKTQNYSKTLVEKLKKKMSKNLRLLRPSLTCLGRAGPSLEEPMSPRSLLKPNFKRNISVTFKIQNDSEIHKPSRLLSQETSTSSCYCHTKRWKSSVTSALLVTAQSLDVAKFLELRPGHSRES